MANKKKNILWKDLTKVLIIKGILFFLLWMFFFSHPASDHINNNQVFVDHLLSQSTSKES